MGVAINTRAYRVTRGRVLVRDSWTCHYCAGPADTVDHLVERKNGGTNDESNLVAACSTCNRGREAFGLSPDDMRRLMQAAQAEGMGGQIFNADGARRPRRHPLSPQTEQVEVDVPLLVGNFTRRGSA